MSNKRTFRPYQSLGPSAKGQKQPGQSQRSDDHEFRGYFNMLSDPSKPFLTSIQWPTPGDHEQEDLSDRRGLLSEPSAIVKDSDDSNTPKFRGLLAQDVTIEEQPANTKAKDDSDTPQFRGLLAQGSIIEETAGISKEPKTAVGIPRTKRRLTIINLTAAIVSVTCMAAGLASVAHEDLSWQLGRGAYQLIILGFLLSIMSLCLSTVVPTFFILIEAHRGSSYLQTYDAILRNAPMGPNIPVYWRLMLAGMIALPLGLSVAYKSFAGGESSRIVPVKEYELANVSFGHHNLLGPRRAGAQIALFFNITLPYITATTGSSSQDEESLSHSPNPYGINTLVLDNRTAAVLDTPSPDLLAKAQDILTNEESWRITVDVAGVVATLSRQKSTHPQRWNETFMDACGRSRYRNDTSTNPMSTGSVVRLISGPVPENRSRHVVYLCLVQESTLVDCAQMSSTCEQFDVSKNSCRVTWSVTRRSVELQGGVCGGNYHESGKVINVNELTYRNWYMHSVTELTAPLFEFRGQLPWSAVSSATAVSAMVWSDITIAGGLEYEGLKLIEHVRPTLRKSPWLYAVITVQPLLLLVILTSRWLLYSVPIENGFGMTAILAGIDRESLELLQGASLSGQLSSNVKLNIRVVKEGKRSAVKYSLVSKDVDGDQGRLSLRKVYH
ncbi:uncharacterized protein FIESC28_04075 [Fusarium coffeatum]|uniref:Transmembrane protein n=1 Tax=Fusarium coffeatum TaxID=231269 RepID=A0A366S340_9HYPO|nr:uncharacterized protein FIESC28_04075 [Fusarium coffeatum]RBR23080.1 hypothetical protein FIESC28_04075 [Fusarium coffeatum]